MRRSLATVLCGSLLLTALTVQTAQATGRLDWGDCPGGPGEVGIECASLKVPVDWNKPRGRQITLVLGRLRSTADKPKGSVLVNFGGPVGISIDLMRKHGGGVAFAGLRERMHIVTWDIRGGPMLPGLSTALPCQWRSTRIPRLPRNQREFDQLAATNRALADECRMKDPELFANMDSASNARDIEAIRRALSETDVNLYGSSYGGVMMQTYARLYPHRVRTLVLDGTYNYSTDRWNRELEALARDSQSYLTRFFDWCRADSSCVLHQRDVSVLLRKLVARANRSPLPAGAVRYDGNEVRMLALYLALDGPSAWPVLAEAIRRGLTGDGSGFTPEQGPAYPAGPTPGVVECTDWPRPANQAELMRTVRRLEAAAPAIGAAGTMLPSLLNCVGWPVPVKVKPAGLPAGLPSLVIAGAWREYESASRVAAQVPGSGSIKYDGPGHTLYQGNTCARALIDTYFVDRKVPPNGADC